MKILDNNSTLIQEVSLGSNELFKETTKEKREEVEHKLLYRIPEDKIEPCIETVQEQYNVPVTAQPQNIENQVQSVVPQQNAVVQSNQNGLISPAFSQRSELKERNYHKYCPIPFDDAIGCVTYINRVNVKAENRITMSEYAMLSRKLRDEAKKDSVDIAFMYIKSVDDYGIKYKLDIDYINADNRQNKVVFVDKEDCISNRLVEVLKKNGICCFNTDFSQKKISEYLYKLVLAKSGNEVYDFPEYSGFNRLNGEYCFVTREYCEKNNYPSVTDKKFEMHLDKSINSERAEQAFLVLADNHNSTEQFLLLNMIRIVGLMSNPLHYCTLKFDRIVFIRGNSERISRYLQIYERDYEILRPYSVNIRTEKLEEYFEDERDNVVMLEDRMLDSVYLKKNGIEAVEFLRGMIFEHANSNYTDYNFITVVFSERLAQLMQSEKSLVLNYTDFELNHEIGRSEFFVPLYYLDRLVIDRVCSNFTDFQSCTLQNYEKYSRIAIEFGVDENTFALLMLAYREILRQYRSVGNLYQNSRYAVIWSGFRKILIARIMAEVLRTNSKIS